MIHKFLVQVNGDKCHGWTPETLRENLEYWISQKMHLFDFTVTREEVPETPATAAQVLLPSHTILTVAEAQAWYKKNGTICRCDHCDTRLERSDAGLMCPNHAACPNFGKIVAQ